MSDITSRKVTRWFFKGKGYSTKRRAYEAKAKALLLDLVLGPVEEVDEYGTKERSIIGASSTLTVAELFAKAFPHGDNEGCVRPGCLSVECQHSLRPDESCAELTNQYGGHLGFAYESCRWSQKQWVKAKVAELIAADGVKP